ncbi:MAG TPA: bifunctional GNAT family N-acetyltransferase/acetate--CoA ligase family protein [Blastocatellia bacterium]|nr:bifunctional GNAT family N-acetyltransferase/acetate--CoA ligase family protein [Blastocatellia bacterium]
MGWDTGGGVRASLVLMAILGDNMEVQEGRSVTSDLEDLSRDILLRDGSMFRLRLARPDDREKLVALFDRCSTQTIRYRFLHLVKALPDSLLDQMTAGSGSRCLALVMTQGEDASERVVAVGLYAVQEDRPDVAEVSFLVEDAMQRRGIGTLMLDVLAELARDRGITRFSADVLGDNRVMLSVFRKAGYGVSATTDYGVTHLEFPIAYSEVANARAEAQEAEAERRSLRSVLAPVSIAVVGAGRDPGSVGGALFRNLLRWNFSGPIYPVNPGATSIAGVHSYPSIAELPGVPELVFIAVKAPLVIDIARQCAAAGVRALCVISSGFAETGPEGAAAEQELVAVCRASGMRLVGPNCMGLVNTSPDSHMLGTFAPADPPAGNVAMSSQSGALGLTLLDQARKLGLGVSSFASIGNRADVSGNDLLQYWEADEATGVILLYLESFGNPRRFARVARRVARAKPIVAVKSGRTTAGAKAAASHTASLASSDRGATALFDQTGIIRVDTLADFFYVARLLAAQPVPAGRRLGIITNAGGPGILAADAAEAAGLEIPALSEEIVERLRSKLRVWATLGNPIDLGPSGGPADYRACLEALCDEPGFDAVLVIFIPPLMTPSAAVAEAMAEVLSARPDLARPVAAVFLDASSAMESIPAGSRTVPVYPFPEGAVAALAAAARYGTWRAEPAGRVVNIRVDRAALDKVINSNSRGWLGADDVAALLGAAGIEILPARTVRSADEAAAVATAMGGPVALKVREPAVLHKSDVGGVMLGVAPADAGNAFAKLAADLAAHGLTLMAASVEPMARLGVEVIAGVTHDSVFGPLVGFGLGGFLVELLDDIAFRVLPLTDRDAAAMIRATRAGRLLAGYRGSRPGDIAAVERLLLTLGALADLAPRIAEIDLNPVIVHPEGEGITLVDARVRLA